MNKKQKEEIALFRYGLIAPVLYGNVKAQMEYFRTIAEKQYEVPHIGKKRFKPETFKSWLKQYRKYGFDALVKKKRYDKGQSRKITGQLAQAIKDALSDHTYLSGSALYRLLVSEGKLKAGYINETTLRKYIRDNKLRRKDMPTPRKKFEKEHINELWTADCMHGPYIKHPEEKKKRKVFLIAAIDDYSRVIVARGWFYHEISTALEIVLKEAILRFGLPKAIYCDNGSLFSNYHLQIACARLGIALIHSKPYDSPSRGKIERFFRTVRDQFLSITDFSEIQDIEQLNTLFQRWLDKQYHKQLHHGINDLPMNRLMQDLKQTTIKRISEHQLDVAFQMTVYRTVKNDATISLKGILYECPPEFIGKKIEIRYPSDKPYDLIVYKCDKPVCRLKQLNPHENANKPAWGIKFAKKEQQND